METDVLIGATLGGCQIMRLIGKGGMASVYHGYQPHLDREVAVKVLPPYYAADSIFVERFQREARAMARLRHPNVITIFDLGEQGQWLFIVMEYITGGNLRQRLQRQTIPWPEIIAIFHDLAQALDFAHDQGIVHRDVKPVNVLIDDQSTRQRAVLSDFGIARMLETSAHLTRTGAGVGTPEYMAPEQCRGLEVDARADIYALGVMLYEVLCGHPPFIAAEYTAIAHAHIYEPVPAPSLLNPHVSLPVQAVVLKALQKRPEQRFATAGEMVLALDQALRQKHGSLGARSGPMSGGFASAPLVCANPQCRLPNRGTNRYCTRCGSRLLS